MDVIPAKAGISPLLKRPVTMSDGVFFLEFKKLVLLHNLVGPIAHNHKHWSPIIEADFLTCRMDP